MTIQRFSTGVFLLSVLGAAMSVSLPAQQAPTVSPSLFAEMRWRNIGPHRAGRTKAAAGHASQPYTFYIGMVNGGVWKTTDAGRSWKPIFDDQPTGSIGWVVVAPSDPNIVYVGSGEGLPRPAREYSDPTMRARPGRASPRIHGRSAGSTRSCRTCTRRIRIR
jgi:hypothetical protein